MPCARRERLVRTRWRRCPSPSNRYVALRDAGVTVLPASTDVEGLPDRLHALGRWLPEANALGLSSLACKEYLGLFLLWIASYE